MTNLTKFKNSNQNEKCPCGSKKKFKKCCMKEYILLKEEKNAKRLTRKEIDKFTKFYQKLLLFSMQDRNNSKKTFTKDEFLAPKEKEYFYDNCDEIIDKFRSDRKISDENLEILEGINRAVYTDFTIVAYNKNYAIVADGKHKYLILVQSLNTPFIEMFGKKDSDRGYLVTTALIPYKGRYIFEGTMILNILSARFHKIYEWGLNFDLEPKRGQSEIIYIPININILVYTLNDNNIIKIDKVLMEKLPKNFTKGLFKFFDTSSINKISLISSFIHVEDLLLYVEESEDNEYDYDELLDWITYSYSKQTVVAPENFLRLYKEQIKPKSLSDDRLLGLYTMQGVVRVEKDNQYDFESFMEKFDNRKVREELMLGFDNLFFQLNREYDLDAKMTFLGVTSYDIEDIREQHNDFFDFFEKEGFNNPTVLELYSIHKNKMIKTLLKHTFKTLFNIK
jgi:hypothetical protein